MKTALFAALCMLPMASWSQAWSNEPAAIFGVRLGDDLSSLRLCPDRDWDNKEPPCQAPSQYAPGLIHLYGLPKLGIPFTAEVQAHAGRIRAVTLHFKELDFGEMRTMLEDRYGPPTSVRDAPVTTIGGANLRSAMLEWKGRSVSIFAAQRVDTIDRSMARFSSNELDAIVAREREQKARTGASKM